MMMYRVPSQPSQSCSHFAAKNGSHSQGATLCLQGQSQTLLQLSRYKSKIDDNWRIVMSLALLLTNLSLLGNLILFSNNSLSGGNIIWTWMVLTWDSNVLAALFEKCSRSNIAILVKLTESGFCQKHRSQSFAAAATYRRAFKTPTKTDESRGSKQWCWANRYFRTSPVSSNGPGQDNTIDDIDEVTELMHLENMCE